MANQRIKMSYYWCNREEILLKAKGKYCEEKNATYYAQNKEGTKEKSREHHQTCHMKKKTRLKSTKQKNIKNWFSIKKKR